MEGKPTAKNPMFYRDLAVEIGLGLVQDAIWHGDRCTWTGDSLEWRDYQWKLVHKTIDGCLYDGTCGIARFLTYLWQVTQQPEFRATAEASLRQSFASIERNPATPLGLYDGLTGIAWVAAEIGSIFQDRVWLDQGCQLGQQVVQQLQDTTSSVQLDLVSGLAGILLGVLRLAQLTGNSSLWEAGEKIANRLLAAATRTTAGWSWGQQENSQEEVHLCGMGHGASGIAHALIEYHAVTQQGEFERGFREAMRYEKGWFNRRHSNWPDLREPDEDVAVAEIPMTYPVFWCHGGAGIGLVRLRTYQLTGDLTMLAETQASIQAAIAAMRMLKQFPASSLQTVSQEDLSICHGWGSTIDLFTYAYQVLGIQEYLSFARRLGDFGVVARDRNWGQWHCGVPENGQSPGLMLGLSGIGMNYLRLWDPNCVPAIGILAN